MDKEATEPQEDEELQSWGGFIELCQLDHFKINLMISGLDQNFNFFKKIHKAGASTETNWSTKFMKQSLN